MSTAQWDDLIEKLQDDDPNVRRMACEVLAATRDPRAISYLRNVYLQEDDKRVRQAAEDGLAMFKAIQLGVERQRPALLSRLALSLVVLLVLSLLLNGLVIVMGGDEDEQTEVDLLIELHDSWITAAQENAATLHTRMARYLETASVDTTGVVDCKPLGKRIIPLPLDPVQQAAYPVFTTVNRLYNQAVPKLQSARTIWEGVCSQQADMGTLVPAGLQDLEEVQAVLGNAESALQTIKDNPPAPVERETPVPPTDEPTAEAENTGNDQPSAADPLEADGDADTPAPSTADEAVG